MQSTKVASRIRLQTRQSSRYVLNQQAGLTLSLSIGITVLGLGTKVRRTQDVDELSREINLSCSNLQAGPLPLMRGELQNHTLPVWKTRANKT